MENAPNIFNINTNKTLSGSQTKLNKLNSIMEVCIDAPFLMQSWQGMGRGDKLIPLWEFTTPMCSPEDNAIPKILQSSAFPGDTMPGARGLN